MMDGRQANQMPTTPFLPVDTLDHQVYFCTPYSGQKEVPVHLNWENNVCQCVCKIQFLDPAQMSKVQERKTPSPRTVTPTKEGRKENTSIYQEFTSSICWYELDSYVK